MVRVSLYTRKDKSMAVTNLVSVKANDLADARSLAREAVHQLAEEKAEIRGTKYSTAVITLVVAGLRDGKSRMYNRRSGWSTGGSVAAKVAQCF